MKTLKLKLFLLLLSSLLVFGCKKKDIDNSGPETPQTPTSLTPAPDDIALITKDFAFAFLCIADINQMMGMSADEKFNHFYTMQPGTATVGNETVTVIRDLTAGYIINAFNKARCLDGKLRDGSIFMDYQYQTNTTPNYFHEPGFTAKITFSNYKVDGWLIELFDPSVQAIITNNTAPNFNPTQTNLSWSITGKFKIFHPSDPGRDLIWDGSLTKTLINTSDTTVYSPTKKTINWNLAKISYNVNVSGTRGTSNAYTYNVDASHPINRNFSCAMSPASFTLSTQFHPFVSGITNLNLNGVPAQATNHNDNINSTSPACDNSGTVKVNGITYSIDL